MLFFFVKNFNAFWKLSKKKMDFDHGIEGKKVNPDHKTILVGN